jgi:hypothetical protein
MARPQHTPSLARLEEALTVPFCLIDDAYALLNPNGCSWPVVESLLGELPR